MKPLIEAGHLYIAQPPLYRVAKGRKERYLGNEKELADYLMAIATEDRIVEMNNGEIVKGEQLRTMLTDLSEYERYLALLRSRRGVDWDVAEFLLQREMEGRELFESEATVETLRTELLENIGEGKSGKREVDAILLDTEHNLYEFSVESVCHGFRKVRINQSLVRSPEYRQLLPLHLSLKPFDHPPFVVTENDSRNEVANRKDLLSHLMEHAKKGLSIQRYKGLGEMNAEQLWETTMNPENRVVLQVRLDEAAEAEEIFTILMGEQVEPRRKFIMDNALEVHNLDI